MLKTKYIVFISYFIWLHVTWTQEKFDVFQLQEPKKYGKAIAERLPTIETPQIQFNQANCLYLENGLRSPNFLYPEKWLALKDGVEVYRIDIVYSKYPLRNGVYNEIYPLLFKRIANLIEIDPNLNNEEITWNKVLQTNCKNDDEANRIFHGVMIWYHDSSDTPDDNDENIQYKPLTENEKAAFNQFISDQSSIKDIKTTVKQIQQSHLIPDSVQKQIANLPFDEQLIAYKSSLKAAISNENAFDIRSANKDEIAQITHEIDVFLSDYYSNDTVVRVVLERHPEWKNSIVINDWTGSMYHYGAEVLKWHAENYERSGIKSITLFNDGDNKNTGEKKLGQTKGIYIEDANKVENVLRLFQYVKLMGAGGDGPENDVEAVLKAIAMQPKADEVILIADNYSCIRDLELAELITMPLKIIVCGYDPKEGISADLVYLAKVTNGSIHTIERDIDSIQTNLSNNKEFIQLDSAKMLIFDSWCNNISTIGNLDSKAIRNQTLHSLREIRRNKDEVRKISLEAMQLEKIPAVVYKINQLTLLDVSNNKITEIPAKIQSINTLKELDLSHNSIKTLPKEFRKLSYLMRLDLAANNLTTIPSALAPLKFLRVLDVSNNRIKAFDKSLYMLKLEELNLANNEITKITKEIGRLQQLKVLNLANNQLTSLPKNLVNLKNLQELDLSNNQLTKLPENLQYFKQLKTLNLKGNRFSEEEIHRIQALLPFTTVMF